MTRALPAAASWLSALVLCASCSATLPHAKRLASAGAAYGRATDALLAVTQQSAADADSARLLSEAQGLGREERRVLLEKHSAVAAAVADLERLRRHARLLTRYFEALGRLAEDDRDAAAADATATAAAALSRLGAELTGSNFLTAPERDALSETARWTVAAARRLAVGRELEARAALIDREISIQRALLDAVRRKLQSDLESAADLGRERDVVRPFLDNAVPDPRLWIAARRGYVLAAQDAGALKNASDAASKLRTSWQSFVSGRFDETARAQLMEDLEAMLAYARTLRALLP